MERSEEQIDWDAVWDRLRQFSAVVEGEGATSAEEKQRILRERAAKLARSAQESLAGRSVTDAIVFRRGTTRYAVELSRLQEIAVSSAITPLPGTPSFCLGIANLRGEILPVFDLPPFFASAGETAEHVEPERVLVLESAGRRVGIAADDVEDAVALSDTDIDPPLATFAGRRAELIRGITPDQALVVDGTKLLDSEHLVVDAGID